MEKSSGKCARILLKHSLCQVLIPAFLAGTAFAQDISEAHPQRVRAGLRYTTGAVTTHGWEKTLTEKNPNLGHWNWSAMTSYTQTEYKKVEPGAFISKGKQKAPPNAIHAQTPLRNPGSIYQKPVHISPETFAPRRNYQMPAQHVDSPEAVHEAGDRALSSSKTGVQARLMPAPAAVHEPMRSYSPKPLSTSSTLSGVLIPPASKAGLPAQSSPPLAKTYADYSLNGRLKPAGESADLEVSGRLKTKLNGAQH